MIIILLHASNHYWQIPHNMETLHLHGNKDYSLINYLKTYTQRSKKVKVRSTRSLQMSNSWRSKYFLFFMFTLNQGWSILIPKKEDTLKHGHAVCEKATNDLWWWWFCDNSKRFVMMKGISLSDYYLFPSIFPYLHRRNVAMNFVIDKN